MRSIYNKQILAGSPPVFRIEGLKSQHQARNNGTSCPLSKLVRGDECLVAPPDRSRDTILKLIQLCLWQLGDQDPNEGVQVIRG